MNKCTIGNFRLKVNIILKKIRVDGIAENDRCRNTYVYNSIIKKCKLFKKKEKNSYKNLKKSFIQVHHILKFTRVFCYKFFIDSTVCVSVCLSVCDFLCRVTP